VIIYVEGDFIMRDYGENIGLISQLIIFSTIYKNSQKQKPKTATNGNKSKNSSSSSFTRSRESSF
jgi:hypothetical protein